MSDTSGAKRGYGKRWKKWLLAYLAAAVVIYGIVFLILQSGGGSGSLY